MGRSEAQLAGLESRQQSKMRRKMLLLASLSPPSVRDKGQPQLQIRLQIADADADADERRLAREMAMR